MSQPIPSESKQEKYRRVINVELLKSLPEQRLLDRVNKAKEKIGQKKERYDYQVQTNQMRLQSYKNYVSELEVTVNKILKERPKPSSKGDQVTTK